MNQHLQHARSLLDRILDTARISASGAEPIRLAANDLWRLPAGIVVRIARSGQDQAARREVAVTRWLHGQGFPAVRPLPMDQPVHAAGHAATFWEELPPHVHGTRADLAPLLRRFHALPAPSVLGLEPLDPFVRLTERITGTRNLATADRSFLLPLCGNPPHTMGVPGRPQTPPTRPRRRLDRELCGHR
ncbi:phosphotransferase [Streptomyces sp. NPDC055078]